jgi:hypothetical protein
MATKSTEAEWVQAREVIVVVGARAPVYQTAIVRSNRTGQPAEVTLNGGEAPPLDEGDPGVSYAFSPREKALADHPAVVDCPGGFVLSTPPRD